jgi:hypothetical protein
VKLARFRKQRAACFLSYLKYRPNASKSNTMKNTKGRSHGMREVKKRKLRR